MPESLVIRGQQYVTSCWRDVKLVEKGDIDVVSMYSGHTRNNRNRAPKKSSLKNSKIIKKQQK
jgi:hypothetical protein